MIQILNKDKITTVSEFYFTNKAGGTGSSNSEFCEKWFKPVKVKVIKCWDDYETGERGWAVPMDASPDFIRYLERNVKKGRPAGEDNWEDTDEYVLFIDEFDVTGKLDEVVSRVVFIPIENMSEFKNFDSFNSQYPCLYFDDGIIIKREHEEEYRKIVDKFMSKG